MNNFWNSVAEHAVGWAGLVLGPGGLVVGAWSKSWFDRKVQDAVAKRTESESDMLEAQGGKFDAEAAKIIADTAVALVGPLQSQISSLENRVKALEDENIATKGKLRRAVGYIKDLMAWISVHVPGVLPPSPPEDLDI